MTHYSVPVVVGTHENLFNGTAEVHATTRKIDLPAHPATNSLPGTFVGPLMDGKEKQSEVLEVS